MAEMVSMHRRQCIIVVKWIKVVVVVMVVMMMMMMALLVKCGVAGEIKHGGGGGAFPALGRSPWHDFAGE
jgi:hypothetical protein